MFQFELSSKSIPDLAKFDALIAQSVPEFLGLIKSGSTISVMVSVEPTSELIAQIEAIVPPASSALDAVIKIVEGAKQYGNHLMNKFAAENVLSGITQAGKTGAVADYLQKLSYYLGTGSLYQAINEIDALIGAGIPSNLAPFVTEQRLLAYKAELMDYLS